MQSVVSSVQKLEFLNLEFLYTKDIEIIYDDLLVACDNGKITRVELILPTLNFHQVFGASEIDICRLADSGPLYALHNTYFGSGITFGDSRIFPKEKLANLPILAMSLYVIINEELIEIINMLPELPELVELQIE